MADLKVAVWPRPAFEPTAATTKLLFVCFGRAPLGDVELGRARFGLPSDALVKQVDVREYPRDTNLRWFENWWSGAFGAIARRDLKQELPQLTESDVCYSLKLELPDQSDLGPLQTVWGLSRWMCARGASVVLDVYAMRFRTAQQLASVSFAASDVEREVKVVFETNPTRGALHLLHTRGLCKVARPELLCFIRPEDASAIGDAMSKLAESLMAGAAPPKVRLPLAAGVQLVTEPCDERELVEALGLEQAVWLRRSDGAALPGTGQLLGKA